MMGMTLLLVVTGHSAPRVSDEQVNEDDALASQHGAQTSMHDCTNEFIA